MAELSLDSIRDAARRIAGRVHRTPMIHTRTLDEMTGLKLYLKAENLQKTGSFKPRGALTFIDRMPAGRRRLGVLAASAGNHAQGLAYAARSLGIPVTVVMPESASPAKVEATRSMGAQVVLHGELFDDALARALRLGEETGATFVHPCTDFDVLSGAGTIGLEILEDLPQVDAIVCPIGGGGLISGIATAVRSLKPDVRIFGVEPEGAPAMKRAMEAGRVVRLDSVRSIADGMAGRAVFDATLQLAQRHVEQVLLVDDRALIHAMALLLSRCKLLAEGAGAAPLAAILEGLLPSPKGSSVVAMISGGNQDLTLLAQWIMQGPPS